MPRLCVIDERGWLVPAEGSMARTVYDVLVAAQQSGEEFNSAFLAQLLGTSANAVQATAWRVRRGAKSSRRSKPAHLSISRRNLQHRQQIATPRIKLLDPDELQKLLEAGRPRPKTQKAKASSSAFLKNLGLWKFAAVPGARGGSGSLGARAGR